MLKYHILRNHITRGTTTVYLCMWIQQLERGRYGIFCMLYVTITGPRVFRLLKAMAVARTTDGIECRGHF